MLVRDWYEARPQIGRELVRSRTTNALQSSYIWVCLSKLTHWSYCPTKEVWAFLLSPKQSQWPWNATILATKLKDPPTKLKQNLLLTRQIDLYFSVNGAKTVRPQHSSILRCVLYCLWDKLEDVNLVPSWELW